MALATAQATLVLVALALALAAAMTGCDDSDDPFEAIPATPTAVLNPSPLPTPNQSLQYQVTTTPEEVVTDALIRVRTRYSGGQNANGIPVRFENLSPNLGYFSKGTDTLPREYEEWSQDGEAFVLFKAIPPATGQTELAFVRVIIGDRSTGEARVELVQLAVLPQSSGE